MKSISPARPNGVSADIAKVGGVVLLTALCAQITLPFVPVPVTLQTLAVMVTALTLGPRIAVTGQVGYLAAGAVGMPVFAGMGAGIGHLIGPTGGFLLAFPLLSLLLGKVGDHMRAKNAIRFKDVLLGTLATFSVLMIGCLWLSTSLGLATAFKTGFLPFLGIEVAKFMIALICTMLTLKKI